MPRQSLHCRRSGSAGFDSGAVELVNGGSIAEPQNTCMDYSTSPTSTQPNQHDYDELNTIYAHLDTSTTISAAATGGPGNAPDWTPAGQMESVHVEQLPNGDEQVTWIEWANPIHPTIF